MHVMQNIGMDSFSRRQSLVPAVLERSESIKHHLSSFKDTVPYFEGLPFIEYEHK